MVSGASWEPPVQQGAEPAGAKPGTRDALQMCRAHGWVPVVMLVSSGCCDSCHGVGLAVAPEGDICLGCHWSRRIGGSCMEAKRRTEHRVPREHPGHLCTPIPKHGAPRLVREYQGSYLKLFLDEKLMPEQMPSHVTQMLEQGGHWMGTPGHSSHRHGL